MIESGHVGDVGNFTTGIIMLQKISFKKDWNLPESRG
jgi:hypothetical protein